MKLTKAEKDAQKMILEQMTKALDLLVKSCETVADGFDSKSVPISHLKISRDAIVRSLKEGIDEANG